MNGINITIAGGLTRDPEVQYTGNGSALAKFSVATERSWRTADGEWDKAVSYIDVVCWKNLAEDVERLLSKGSRVIITGRLDQQSWEDKETGAKRSRLELTADEVAISLRSVESFERKVYSNDGDRQPVGAGARAGASRPASRPAPRPAPANDDAIWDN